jgi:hypothetical protein
MHDDSMFGVTTTGGDPAGGLYGAGRFGYSIPFTATAACSSYICKYRFWHSGSLTLILD